MGNILSGDAWVQPVDSAYLMSQDGVRQLRRTWKGSTKLVAEIEADLYVDQPYGAALSQIAGKFGVVDDAGLSISWDLPNDLAWRVSGVEIKQIEAGQCSLLTVVFQAKPVSYDPGTPFAALVQDTIGVQWQTYSVSPYRYCNEREHADALVKQDGTALSADNKASMRAHIEQALTQNSIDKGRNWKQYLAGNNISYELTKAEQLIAEKIAAGTNPVFHYPIVQHTRVVETNLSSVGAQFAPDVAAGVDLTAVIPYSIAGRIADALEPWENLSGSYIYCGQSASCQTREVNTPSGRKTIYTWTLVDTFEGALEPDLNFYGTIMNPADPDGRWTFGVGPQPN